MKSFRGTLFSSLVRVATALEAQEDRREAAAKRKIENARGPKGVAKAREALRKLREGRHDRVMKAFLYETKLALGHYRFLQEREIGGGAAHEISEWVMMELPHTMSILLMGE